MKGPRPATRSGCTDGPRRPRGRGGEAANLRKDLDEDDGRNDRQSWKVAVEVKVPRSARARANRALSGHELRDASTSLIGGWCGRSSSGSIWAFQYTFHPRPHERPTYTRALLPAGRRHPAGVPAGRLDGGPCRPAAGRRRDGRGLPPRTIVLRLGRAGDAGRSSFPRDAPVLFVVSQVGLVLYMFCVGLEFRTELMAGTRGGRPRSRSPASRAVRPRRRAGAVAARRPAASLPSVRAFHAVLFVGAAMSITAFPMLARIIYERGMAGTALGSLALAAGAIDDACAWIILAIVLGRFTGSNAMAGRRRRRDDLRRRRGLGIRPIFARLNRRGRSGGASSRMMSRC